ncbi:MAG TPA: sigma-70 family RNA polymerase sigma factor [Pyrinomonadaceae bacterium]|nr:sigma-70 family RNA polymerase sigma factor [Pyrinomonadaceae bacterium]
MSSSERAPTPADTELLHAIARGDESSLAALYDRYSAILLGLLLRILHDRPEAEDVLQEVFLQVWRRAHDFDEARGRGFTWLVTLARSRAIDRLRSIDARTRAATAAGREVREETVDATDDVLHSEQRVVVQAALAQLPEEQRRALWLAYYDGLTQAEIAAQLNQPLGTIKTRMRSGLIKLRELLREQSQTAHLML